MSFLGQSKRSDRKNKSIKSVISQKIRSNNLTLTKADTEDSIVKKDSDFEKRNKFIPAKLVSNVKAGILLASSDDSFAPFNTKNYEKLFSKHSKCSSINVPFFENIDSFIASQYNVYKSITHFPTGSGAGPNGLAPQVLKVFVFNSNGSTGHEFWKSLTELVSVTPNNTVPENIRLFFFGAKLIAFVKKDGGLRPIAIGNTLRRVVAKCGGSKVSD